jgi:hypothetical protein
MRSMSCRGESRSLGASAGTRLWQVVDQPVPIQLLDPLRGERRSGTITQQPLEPAPVIRFDAHACIQGESAAVLPWFHVPAILLLQYPAPHEGPQDAAAHLGLYRLGILPSSSSSAKKRTPSCGSGSNTPSMTQTWK